jgi:hypothetical protein
VDYQKPQENDQPLDHPLPDVIHNYCCGHSPHRYPVA